MRSSARLRELAPAWQELEGEALLRSPFLRHAWQVTWTDAFVTPQANREPFLLTVWHKERLAGVAPFYRLDRRTMGLRVRELVPIGSPEGGADHLDILAARGREQLVADAIRGALWGELAAEWDVLRMVDVPGDSITLAHMLRPFENDGKYIDVRLGAFCPVLELPASRDRIIGDLGARHREALRRNVRAVQRLGTVAHETFTGSEILSRIDTLLAAHAQRWPGQDPCFYPFLKSLLAENASTLAAQLDCLTINGTTVASFLHFDVRDCRSLYLLGVDRTAHPDVNTGKVLLQFCLERAVEAGFRSYDFLRGEESYKFDWATTGRRSLTVSLRQKRMGPVLDAAARSARDVGKNLLR